MVIRSDWSLSSARAAYPPVDRLIMWYFPSDKGISITEGERFGQINLELAEANFCCLVQGLKLQESLATS